MSIPLHEWQTVDSHKILHHTGFWIGISTWALFDRARKPPRSLHWCGVFFWWKSLCCGCIVTTFIRRKNDVPTKTTGIRLGVVQKESGWCRKELVAKFWGGKSGWWFQNFHFCFLTLKIGGNDLIWLLFANGLKKPTRNWVLEMFLASLKLRAKTLRMDDWKTTSFLLGKRPIFGELLVQ